VRDHRRQRRPLHRHGAVRRRPHGLQDHEHPELRYRVYLSVPYVKFNIARDLLGMVDPEDAPESDELAQARERAEAAELALGLLDEAKKVAA
jgi:hypothetical protein